LFSAVNHEGNNKVASHTMQKIVGSQKENLLAWINMKKKKIKISYSRSNKNFFQTEENNKKTLWQTTIC